MTELGENLAASRAPLVQPTRENGDALPAGEPIAIVGMACRFPGSPDLASFWRLLQTGGNAVTEGIPGSGVGRVGELYPSGEVQNPACRFGAFIEDIDQFDAEFFRISPIEAQLLDPQQRLMLETSWQALEDTGIDPERLKGSRTGVYIGISNMDYRLINLDSTQTAEAAASLYTVSGTSLNTAAGRVAFALGFEGPAMAVDTACSSSLVAIHQATSSLQRGEADMILAGGVQAILNGRLTELRANARMLSPDGQCKAFDASANGFVRGEGCGIVVLKRLSDAIADGDRIWGLIRGSAINQDGTSAGFTVPSERAQAEVISQALRKAGVAPSEVDYLEAHGTGTEVGDPIELNAAAEIYGTGRELNRPLLVGSVKTNIGHLEPAAGVAGLIKTVLAMRRGVIPKHLHFQNPNPDLDWDQLPMRVTSTMTDWPTHNARLPLAGVSAFGWSGTNVHLVVEGYGAMAEPGKPWPSGASRLITASPTESLPDLPSSESHTGRQTRLLPISGKTDNALKDLSLKYKSWLDEQAGALAMDPESAEPLMADMAWTASVGRSHFNHRAGVLYNDFDSLRDALTALADEERAQHRPVSNVAFVYTGQASQWVGMGEALYRTEPVFRAALDRCNQVLQRERGVSLLDVMFGQAGAEADLDDPAWTQPAIYALESALTALWASVGIKPSVVAGHSLGEIAASQAAGVFSLEEGLRFAAARGELMGSLPPNGAMAAVFAPPSAVTEVVSEYNGASDGVGLSVAVDNGTHQVISGPAVDVEAVLERFEAQEVRVRRLRPSPAYHSALVEPILDGLEAAVRDIAPSPPEPSVTLVSNITGRMLEPGETLDASYWRRHARQPVAFRSCVETMAELGVDAVVEIGPHAVLGPIVSMNWPEPAAGAEAVQSPVVLSSLLRPPRDQEGPPADASGGFMTAAATAYEAGMSISFEGLFNGETRQRVSLPSYPFQWRRHWVETSKRRRVSAGHPLLGDRHESPRGESCSRRRCSLRTRPG